MKRRLPEPVELSPDRIGTRGDGIAAWEGRDILVPGLFPGERGLVQISHLSRGGPQGRGDLLELTSVLPERREPPCPDHQDHLGGRCGGCPLMPLESKAQLRLKAAALEHTNGLQVDRMVSDEQAEMGYRWSAKRVVGGRTGRFILGSYETGTHRVAPMSRCIVDHPRIVACAEEVRELADELRIEPYRPASEKRPPAGDLRYLWLKTDGERVLLTLITRTNTSRAARELAPRLQEAAGVAWSVQAADTDAVRGAPAEPLCGDQVLRLDLAGASTEVGPLGFLQPNPRIASLIYRDLLGTPGGRPLRGRLAFDLYAGAGITSALLRSNFDEVRACEAYPESAAALGIEPEPAAGFLRQAIDEGVRPDLIVANPPRSGFDEDTCSALVALAAPRLNLMSCSPSSLARDLNRLAPAYTLVELRGYDTLPQTAHLELVAWLKGSPVAGPGQVPGL